MKTIDSINFALQVFESVRHAPFMEGYLTAPFARMEADLQAGSTPKWNCIAPGRQLPVFEWIGASFLSELLERANRRSSPQVTRSPVGLYCIAVPISTGVEPSSILCSGIRESNLNLKSVEMLAGEIGVEPIWLLEEMESLPVSNFTAVSEVAARIMTLARLFMGEEILSVSKAKGMDNLRIIADISAELDKAETAEDLLSLLCETLGLLFDLSDISIIRPFAGKWRLEPLWGNRFEPLELSDEIMKSVGNTIKSKRLNDREFTALHPQFAGASAHSISFDAGSNDSFTLIMFGQDFSADDISCQELLVSRAALRLNSIALEDADNRKLSYDKKLLTIFRSLAEYDDLKEISQAVLDGAVDLVGANSGSLMLLDQKSELLSIVAVKGMNPTLAKNLNIRMGSGIAGQVAKSGSPLLVNDIKNDARFSVGSRPRFKSGSLLSIPLVCRGETYGVINLSDRKDGAPFDASDLSLLECLAGQAASLMRRLRNYAFSDRLEKLSITDPLTELYNRRFLERRMDEEIARSDRHGLKLTLMLLDLDNFKDYNDKCGHQAGDEALRKVAAILGRSVREMDVVTRYGGEEFCILLPDTPKVDAMYVAERIRYGVESEFFPGEERMPSGGLTISIGIASFPENGTNSSDLITTADVALYQAKAEGRNRIKGSTDLPSTGHFKAIAKMHSIHIH